MTDPDAENTPTTGGVLSRLWTAWRGLPVWAQVIGWIVAWPVLGAAFLARWPRLGRVALPVGAVFALLFAPVWIATLAGGSAGNAPPEITAEPGAPAADASGEPDTADDEDPSASDTPPPDESEPEATQPEATEQESSSESDPARARQVTATDPSGDLEVHFIDVGQADAALLKAPDATVLIDAGHWQRNDVVPYLRAHGVTTIDLIVITHPHADHIGQFDKVMDAFTVTEVWWSGATHTTQTFERALDALDRSDAFYEEPRAGDTTAIGSLKIEVVNPPPTADFRDLHDTSLSFRVTYGDVRFLFTGDAETPTEARMVRNHRAWLRADVYQVGHHGSRTSTTAGFLDAVSPAVAVYSAGAGNTYGHPHDEVVDRLKAAGVDTYGTDVHGTVVVTTDGTSWRVSTGRDGILAAPRAPPSDDQATGTESPTPTPAPTATATPTPEPDTSAAGCGPGQVNINTAGLEELQEIVHIGPVRAEEMLQIRPFRSVDDMSRITGIAAGRLAEIKAEGIACAG